VTAPAKFYKGGRPTGAAVRGIAPIAAYKTLAESVVSNNTTLQADDALLLQLNAGAVYLFKLKVGYTAANGTGDIHFGWSVPSGASMGYAAYGDTGGAASDAPWYTTAQTPVFSGNGTTPCGAIMKGTCVTGEAGALQLMWCQHTSSTTATTVLSGSDLLAWQVA
jgi:hypothetical protein